MVFKEITLFFIIFDTFFSTTCKKWVKKWHFLDPSDHFWPVFEQVPRPFDAGKCMISDIYPLKSASKRGVGPPGFCPDHPNFQNFAKFGKFSNFLKILKIFENFENFWKFLKILWSRKVGRGYPKMDLFLIRSWTGPSRVGYSSEKYMILFLMFLKTVQLFSKLFRNFQKFSEFSWKSTKFCRFFVKFHFFPFLSILFIFVNFVNFSASCGSSDPFSEAGRRGGVDTLLDNSHFWPPQKGGHFWTPKSGHFGTPFLEHLFWHFVYFSDANFIKSGQKVGKKWTKNGTQNGSFFGSTQKSRILWVFRKFLGWDISGPLFFTFFHFFSKMGTFGTLSTFRTLIS